MSMNVDFVQAVNTRPYGYDLRKQELTSEQAMKDFKPSIMPTPEQQEKANKKQKALLITAGVLVAAGLTYFFTKGKGKEWIKSLINKFNSAPREKVKMVGKEDAHKVRRNKRAIIEATKLTEEAERFTEKELQEYAKSIAYKAPTAEQAKVIAKQCSKPATTSLADVISAQGIERTKEGVRVVLNQKPASQVVDMVAQASEAVVDNAAKIAELQAKIAKQETTIAKYNANPAMARYTKPYEAAKAELLKELEQLQTAVRSVA